MKYTYICFWPYVIDHKKDPKFHDLEIKFCFTKICTSKDFSKLNGDNKHCFEHLSGYAMSRRTTKPKTNILNRNCINNTFSSIFQQIWQQFANNSQ